MTLETYDPNLVLSGRSATQTVRLTFQQWEYTVTEEVSVGGSCGGMSVMETALEYVYDRLPVDDHGYASLVMKDANQNELTVDDDDDGQYDWLRDMLVKVEIIKVELDPLE